MSLPPFSVPMEGVMRSEKPADPFYSSGPWRAVRVQALQRDLYICQECLKEWQAGQIDRPRDADMVHHIIPRTVDPSKELDLDNLVSLCWEHHEAHHPERRRRNEQPARPDGIRIIKI